MSDSIYVECSFLIPLNTDAALSTGEPHATTSWEWLTDRLWVDFGGGTIPQCVYEGFYTDPDTGQRVSDRSRKYIVALPEVRVEYLRELLAECCDVFQQKMIYLSVAGRVEFIERPAESS